ncbi:MAG TPA: hypothetical protein VGN64_09235 [Dyadobacter sp.]|nr:hypothetical protein [Dyadobacter sp.]
METTIKTTKKEKAVISSESNLTDLFINVTANFNKKTFADDKEIANEYMSGVSQVQFNIGNFSDASKVQIAELITKAIEDAKFKLG